MKFFAAYDLSREQNIEILQKKLEAEKKANMKAKNT